MNNLTPLLQKFINALKHIGTRKNEEIGEQREEVIEFDLKKIKIIKVFIHGATDSILPIFEYLSSISGVALAEHDSDMRYGGMYYYHGKSDNLMKTLVPTVYLSL